MAKYIYDVSGNEILLSADFDTLINYRYCRDTETGAFYVAVNVPQTDYSGNKQYPFTLWANYPNGGTQSPLQMNMERKFLVSINGTGIKQPWGPGVTVSGLPLGIVIQNGVCLQEYDGGFGNPTRTLTIDQNGVLGYVPLTVTGAELVQQGIVSTASGYFPLVVNYQDIDNIESDIAEWLQSASATGDAQRQVLCQYENGDYLIITTEGRNNRGGGFFTFKQVQRLCKQYGVKFAYILDGGGSAQTVVGDKALNNIYENTYGRVMPTYIVFNGTTQFKATNS